METSINNEGYYINNISYQISIDISTNNNENNYIDNTSFQISIDTSINNEIETLVNTINTNTYTKSYLTKEIDISLLNSQLPNSNYSSESDVIIKQENEIKNRTELIKNMINALFEKVNISDINNGKMKKQEIKIYQ